MELGSEWEEKRDGKRRWGSPRTQDPGPEPQASVLSPGPSPRPNPKTRRRPVLAENRDATGKMG